MRMKDDKNTSAKRMPTFAINEGCEKKGGLNTNVPPRPSTPPPSQKSNNIPKTTNTQK